jgi:hypothetical protein
MHRHHIGLAALYLVSVPLLAGIEWVAWLTDGLALVPIAAGLVTFRLIAGHWLPSRDPQPARADQ